MGLPNLQQGVRNLCHCCDISPNGAFSPHPVCLVVASPLGVGWAPQGGVPPRHGSHLQVEHPGVHVRLKVPAKGQRRCQEQQEQERRPRGGFKDDTKVAVVDAPAVVSFSGSRTRTHELVAQRPAEVCFALRCIRRRLGAALELLKSHKILLAYATANQEKQQQKRKQFGKKPSSSSSNNAKPGLVRQGKKPD